MWMMMVWRPLVLLLGVGGIGEAGLVTTVLSRNPFASNMLMYSVLLMMAAQAVVCAGLIVAGVWNPMRRWARGLGAPAPT